MPLTAGAGAAIAGGLGLLGAIGTTGASAGLTARARRENYKYNEMAAENAFKRQMSYAQYLQQMQYKQFYDLESPQAIIKQLREAGLSPSIYAQNAAGGGVSGTSAAGASAPQGAGASGVGAAQVGVAPIDAAQIQLTLAQADKAKEEANAMRGENAQGAATISDTLASAGLKEAQKDLTVASTCFQEMQNYITDETKDATIKEMLYKAQTAEYNTYKAFYEAANSDLEWQWNKETYNERVKGVAAYNANLIAGAYEYETRGKLNEEQRAKVIAETEKIYNELFYYNDVDFQNAKAYQEWYAAQAENLPERLELMAKELKLENKKMWLNFGTESAKAIGTALGMYFFGKKGGQAPIFTQKPFQLDTSMPAGKVQTLSVYPM